VVTRRLTKLINLWEKEKQWTTTAPDKQKKRKTKKTIYLCNCRRRTTIVSTMASICVKEKENNQPHGCPLGGDAESNKTNRPVKKKKNNEPPLLRMSKRKEKQKTDEQKKRKTKTTIYLCNCRRPHCCNDCCNDGSAWTFPWWQPLRVSCWASIRSIGGREITINMLGAERK